MKLTISSSYLSHQFVTTFKLFVIFIKSSGSFICVVILMRKLLYESHNQQKQFNFISIIYMRYSYRIVCIKHWPFNHNPMEKKLLNCPMRIVKYQTNKWQMSRVAVVVLPTHLSFWRLRRDYWVITNSHTHTHTHQGHYRSGRSIFNKFLPPLLWAVSLFLFFLLRNFKLKIQSMLKMVPSELYSGFHHKHSNVI